MRGDAHLSGVSYYSLHTTHPLRITFRREEAQLEKGKCIFARIDVLLVQSFGKDMVHYVTCMTQESFYHLHLGIEGWCKREGRLVFSFLEESHREVLKDAK